MRAAAMLSPDELGVPAVRQRGANCSYLQPDTKLGQLALGPRLDDKLLHLIRGEWWADRWGSACWHAPLDGAGTVHAHHTEPGFAQCPGPFVQAKPAEPRPDRDTRLDRRAALPRAAEDAAGLMREAHPCQHEQHAQLVQQPVGGGHHRARALITAKVYLDCIMRDWML